jgi:glutaredoxin
MAENPAMRAILALALAAAFLTAHAQVYKWTDPSGKVHYGDRPPDEAKTEKLKLDIQSYDGPPQVTNWADIINRKIPPGAGSRDITMYSTTWCVHCKRARIYFAANAIRYRDIDVESSEANRKEWKDLGGRGVPLIFVGEKMMRGFSEQSMNALLRKPSP